MGEEDLEQMEGDILDSLEDIGYAKVRDILDSLKDIGYDKVRDILNSLENRYRRCVKNMTR